MPAPPRSNSSAVVVVVVVVVVVALLFLVPVMYVLTSGLGPAQAPTPPTAVMQGGGSWRTNGVNSTYTFTISTVSPAGTQVDPAQLQYIASNTEGTTLYSGAAGQSTTASGFAINVLFQDPLNPGVVSAGDSIQVWVSPAASNPLLGGRLQLNFNGNSMGIGTM